MSIMLCHDKQKICDNITQLESALDRTLQRIFEWAGDRIKPDVQVKIQQDMANTKQLLERLRTQYESKMDSIALSIPSALEPISKPQCSVSTAPRLLQESQ